MRSLSLYLSLSLPSRPLCTVTRRHRANSIFVGDSHSIEYIDYYLSIVTIPITQFDGTKNVRTRSDTCADASGYAVETQKQLTRMTSPPQNRIKNARNGTHRKILISFDLKGFLICFTTVNRFRHRPFAYRLQLESTITHAQTDTHSRAPVSDATTETHLNSEIIRHIGRTAEREREEKRRQKTQIRLSYLRGPDVDRRNAAYSRNE